MIGLLQYYRIKQLSKYVDIVGVRVLTIVEEIFK